MAFGQASGPPASHSQLRELTELLEAAGHTDFRDARGPMGFTQRQASGKFTRDEADEFIAALQEAAHESSQDDDTATPEPPPAQPAPARPRTPRPKAARPKAARQSSADASLESFSDDDLAAELQRCGWVVMEP